MTWARRAARRFATLSGIATTPGRVLVLAGAVLTAAFAAAIGLAASAEFPPHDPVHPLARLGIVVGVMTVAQLARLRIPVGSGRVSVTWGEAALIIGLYLVPAGWLPAATLVAGGVACTLLSIFSERRTAVDVVHGAGSLTGAVVLATEVTTLLGSPFRAAPTPAVAGALILGSLTYLLTTAWLVALTLSLQHRIAMTPLLLRALHGKLLMFVGNVLVGLVVVAMIDEDPRWLLLLPPALWLLQQTYRHRLRAGDEQRIWQVFAGVTKSLNQLDEPGVADAGVKGALILLDAEQVELDVVRSDGGRRRYARAAGGELMVRDLAAVPAADTDQSVGRRLQVGGLHVGDLRVRFRGSTAPGLREQMALSAFSDALGAALHDAATHRELRIVTARSSYEAVHDPLTNLVNRAAMLSKADSALHGLAHHHPVALVLLDIDHFKEVNDTLGHAAGDELLQVTAARLGALTRPDELLGRLGGDEFALLVTSLPLLGDAAARADAAAALPQAMRRAREIVAHLAVPTQVGGVQMSVEASVGVVVAGAGTVDMAELLRRADIAMYQAKAGGSSVASYDGRRDAASTDRLALLAELREALAVDDQLVLALQPAVDLSTAAPIGVEALIRWRHPRRGSLNPSEFIRAVEGSELLSAFTCYVIDKALVVAADWAGQGLNVPVAVNISARSLLDPRLPGQITELLRRHQVPAHRLVLEITETVVMSELEVIDEVLAGLRGLGVQLAVDDFGTGFSSLTFLTRIAVDELKVDRSFVIAMVDSPQAAAIVRAAVDLARRLGIRVVAEGVETADQRAALAALGCTAGQGYHFCKPMPADKIVTVLRSLTESAQGAVVPLRADGAS